MPEAHQQLADRWIWRRWFAWRPVYAMLLRTSDPSHPVATGWDGLPMQTLVWLRPIDRRFVLGRWHYVRRARVMQFADRAEPVVNAAAFAQLALPQAELERTGS